MTVRPLLSATAAATFGVFTIRSRVAAREREIEARYPREGDLIDVDGVRVHAVVRGTGRDLVMIHGASGNSRDFTFSMMDRLADRFRVIAMDRPGLGYTGRTDPAYDDPFSTRAETPTEQARLLRAAALRLGAPNPLVLGQSFGGTVALAWALEGGVAALVLVSALAMEWPGGIGPLYPLLGSAPGGALLVPAITANLSEAEVNRIIHRTFRPQSAPEGYDAHIGGLLTLRRASLRANFRQLNNLKPQVRAMARRYSTLALPIEWVHGTADETVPARIHAEPFARLVPQTRLTLVDGIGHAPHHSAEDEVIAAIDRAATRAS
jgi:pimeloyl-ACP methyl ester carboxylesterase